jgi:hypothetical protein
MIATEVRVDRLQTQPLRKGEGHPKTVVPQSCIVPDAKGQSIGRTNRRFTLLDTGSLSPG